MPKYRFKFDRIQPYNGFLTLVYFVDVDGIITQHFQPIPDDSFVCWLDETETLKRANVINAISLALPLFRSFSDLSKAQQESALQRIFDTHNER